MSLALNCPAHLLRTDSNTQKVKNQKPTPKLFLIKKKTKRKRKNKQTKQTKKNKKTKKTTTKNHTQKNR